MAEEKILKTQRGQKERIISIIVLVLILVTIWYMLDIVLLTFIITFVFYNFVELIQGRRRKLMPVILPDGFVLSVLYIFFIAVFGLASVEFAPKLALQFTEIANIFMKFDINAVKDSMDPRIAELLTHVDFNKYISEAGLILAGTITKIGGFGFNLFISLILSFLILLEKKKIRRFGERLGDSRIAYIYDYIVTFGGNFARTFGKVMKVQITIATINAFISMAVLSFFGFPQIMSLGIMIFILGLIPVAGVVISLIPLSIIAFNLGGIGKVFIVFIMIIVIHSIEAYILNPKLMSDKTELPVCLIFIILLVGEHYMGVWGLLIGVPVFIFMLNALEVDYYGVCKKQ